MQSAPITSPYNHPPPFYFGGVGAPPMPIGVPPMPIGAPSRYVPPLPVPGMHYDYSPGDVHGPYGLLTTFPPGGTALLSVYASEFFFLRVELLLLN